MGPLGLVEMWWGLQSKNLQKEVAQFGHPVLFNLLLSKCRCLQRKVIMLILCRASLLGEGGRAGTVKRSEPAGTRNLVLRNSSRRAALQPQLQGSVMNTQGQNRTMG